LIDIQPHDASYFYSHGDPFSEEGIIDFNRMKEWVKKFKLKFYQYHASGHAPQSELKRIVESIAPEVVIPIHSEEPEKYKNLIDLPILLPSRGHKIFLGN
jgi:ribonuclease J